MRMPIAICPFHFRFNRLQFLLLLVFFSLPHWLLTPAPLPRSFIMHLMAPAPLLTSQSLGCQCISSNCAAVRSVYASARLWDPLKFSMAPIYMCTKCRRPYKTKYTLRRHERFECGLPAMYKCEQCDYRAKHKHSVKQHVESVHEKRKLSYTWRSIL